MDMMSMVSSMLAMQAGSTQMQIAATIMKSNADAEKSAVLTLLGAACTARLRRPMSAPASAAISIFGLKPPQSPAATGFIAAVISFDGVVAGPFRRSGDGGDLAAWPSTSTEVGIPSARPIALRS